MRILGNSRLQDPSLTSRITLIAVVVWELRKSQDGIVALSRIWTSFGNMLFETNITIDFGKVFYRKVIENLLRFPKV